VIGRLGEAEECLALHRARLSEPEAAFLATSVERREAEVEERERLQRRISFGLAVFLAVALALTGLVGWQWHRTLGLVRFGRAACVPESRMPHQPRVQSEQHKRPDQEGAAYYPPNYQESWLGRHYVKVRED
jgi:hypothetical protein